MHIDLQSEKTTGISAARHIRSFNEAENVLVTSNFIIQLATNINIISVCLYRQTNSPQQKQYLSLIENRCKVFQLVSLSTGLEKKVLFTCCKCLQLEVIQREFIYFFCRSQCHGRQRTRIFYDFNDRTLGKYIHTCESEMNGII